MQSLRRAVLLACDRDIANNGLKSNFFGEGTILPGDAARIAMWTGAAIVPAFNLRRGDGRYDVYLEPVIDIVPAEDGVVAKNMEQVAHVMEKYIRSYPEQSGSRSISLP